MAIRVLHIVTHHPSTFPWECGHCRGGQQSKILPSLLDLCRLTFQRTFVERSGVWHVALELQWLCFESKQAVTGAAQRIPCSPSVRKPQKGCCSSGRHLLRSQPERLRLVRSQGVKNQGHTENEGCGQISLQ